MKIKRILIQGFRGFNTQRTIDLHERLTLIYAPNSYGKTSISEALEWLLYGITSKVERADSKDEYKGSYRNLHLDSTLQASVSVKFFDNGNDVVYTGILTDGDAIKRFVGEKEVQEWPIEHDLSKAAKPFILQHALKYLLLAKPDERFQGFTNLLGLEDLETIQRNVRSLCTKPDAIIPEKARQTLGKISSIESRLASQSKLSEINKAYKKGAKGLKKTYQLIDKECILRVPPGTGPDSILPQLLKRREDAVNKIFKGSIVLHDYIQQENENRKLDEKYILSFVDVKFIQKYTDLVTLSAARYILDRINFYRLGIGIMDKEPGNCPFCMQPVNDLLDKHIRQQHQTLLKEQGDKERLEKQRDEVKGALLALRSKLSSYHVVNINKSTKLLDLEPSMDNLKKILVPKYQIHFHSVENTISAIKAKKEALVKSYDCAINAIDAVVLSITDSKEDAELLKILGSELAKYISCMSSHVQLISNNSPQMAEANRILQHELDQMAGTEDISILIDLIEQRKVIEKSFEIRDIMDGLKELRNSVDDYVVNKIIDAISADLTAEVMEWYDRIKTTGDPDVHFSGFDMERTKEGKVKPRRVQVKAKSYGKELVSAVSSLSESKLNALGLCVNIARNLREPSPFSFLIIDDPIQSWDADHEAQFIELIRHLIDRGKQILLMSHNQKWIRMVLNGCRSVNGRYYEFTSYTRDGPYIVEMRWATFKDRLDEVDAICKNPSATNVQLQQAEEEIRIICAELTCEIYLDKKGIKKSPHNLNSNKVRKMLLESGVDTSLVDRITETYQTTDDSHHAPADYSPNRERIKKYHSWCHELSKVLN